VSRAGTLYLSLLTGTHLGIPRWTRMASSSARISSLDSYLSGGNCTRPHLPWLRFRRQEFFAYHLADGINDRSLLNESDKSVVHERLIIARTCALDLRPKVLDNGVVDTNRYLRLPRFKWDDSTSFG